MKLSDRDFKLIIILGIAVLIVLPILLIIRPVNENIKNIDGSIAEKRTRRDFLLSLKNNIDFYDTNMDKLDEAREDLIKGFAKGIRRENTIMFLATTERELQLNMEAIGFTDTDTIVISEDVYDGDTLVEHGLTANSCISTVAYHGNYTSIKKLLDLILNNKERMVISSISAAQNPDTGLVDGTFLLEQYAVSGGKDERTLEAAKIPEFQRGNKNVFGRPTTTAQAEEEGNNEEEGEE